MGLAAVIVYSLLLAAYLWPLVAFVRATKISKAQKVIWVGLWIAALVAGHAVVPLLHEFMVGKEVQAHQVNEALMYKLWVLTWLPPVCVWILYAVFIFRTRKDKRVV